MERGIMLFLTKKGLYVNINTIKTIEPVPVEDIFLVTFVDGKEEGFSAESGRNLIEIMGVNNG